MSLVDNPAMPIDTIAVPATNAPRFSNSAAIFAISWLTSILGVHVMFAGFFLIGRKSIHRAEISRFTEWGFFLYHPERDLIVYILGCLLTAAIGLRLMSTWKRSLAAVPESQSYSASVARCAFTFALAFTATIINPIWLFTYREFYLRIQTLVGIDGCIVLLPVFVELAVFFWSQRAASLPRLPTLRGLRRLMMRFAEPEDASVSVGQADNITSNSLIAWHWFDALVPCLIFAVVYIPHFDVVAGTIFQSEHFHHWDYFAMGPAIGYLHGGALGTQVYSQYGLGLPWLMALLNPIYPLTYGHLIQFANVYGCLYFFGAYLFLRLLLRSKTWSALGVALLIYYKLFIWTLQYSPAWQLPSNTILRAPFDIWFLMALLLHYKSRRNIWLLAAGALTGLSLFFETDTGVYITFTFAVYSLLWNWQGAQRRNPVSDTSRWKLLLTAWLLATGVLLTGMNFAGRGTVLQPAFWRGWIECFTAYPSGISMMPVTEHTQGMQYGMVMLGTYLLALGFCFHRFRDNAATSNSTPDSVDLPLLCVALYGLGTMIHFIGRSHPTNLYVGAMGYTVLLILGVSRLVNRFRPLYLPHLSTAGLNVRVVMAFALIGMAMTVRDSAMNQYPNSLRELYKRVQPRELTFFTPENGFNPPYQLGTEKPEFVEGTASPPVPLYPGSDVSLPESIRARMEERYWPAVAEIRALTLRHQTVAILANDETWMVLASGASQWYRYTPLFPNIITIKQKQDAENALAARPVDYVYVEAKDPLVSFVSWFPLMTSDIWLDLRQVTREHYTFDHQTGIYEVYRRF